MAEVFGAVASGIGIAGVAAQAIDGIRKLQTFCNDIRNAPEEVKYLTTELEILLGTIASIEAQIQRNSTMCQNMDPTPALRFVDQSVRSLNAVIEKLNAEIAQKKTLGSMKMAWKKKVLESHLIKIERSKTSLGLAVSAYSTEPYLQTAIKTDTRVDQLSMNVTTLTASCHAQLKSSSNAQINASQHTRQNDQLHVGDSNIEDWQASRKQSKPPKRTSVISFTLLLPTWLAQRSLQIDVRRAAQSWILSLRPYRTVGDEALIFGEVACGNFDRMRDFIETGQATVFDRWDDGMTLLHVLACSVSRYDRETFLRTTRYLIDRGADINEPWDTGTLAIHMFCCSNVLYPLGLSNDIRVDDVFEVLGNEVDFNVDLFWQNFSRGTYTGSCSPMFEKELKRRFPSDTLDLPEIKMSDRLRDTQSTLDPPSPSEVASYLGFENFETAYLMSSDNTKRDLFCISLHAWGHTSTEPNIKKHEEWDNTIQELFALGARFELLSSGEVKEKTPGGLEKGMVQDGAVVEVIRQFVVGYGYAKSPYPVIQDDPRLFVNGFQYFVSKTEHLGIRLGPSAFCRRFELRVDHRFVFSTNTSDAEYDGSHKPYDFCLYYDDDLSIWIIWDSTYETYCGEFWDLIDHPERTMPGTWID